MPRQPPAQITPAAKAVVVTGLEHGGEGQHAHQRDHRADDTGGGGEDGAGHQRRHRHGTGKMPGGELQREEQPIDDIGPLYDVTHEQE